jgi:predicted metal-dependent hydrolase
MTIPPIHLDPRFAAAVEEFNRGEYADASDLFEDLFFEAAGDELEFARTFLQLSVGFLHADQGQRRPAVARLEEGIRAIDRVKNNRGVHLVELRREVVDAIEVMRQGRASKRPVIERRSQTSG